MIYVTDQFDLRWLPRDAVTNATFKPISVGVARQIISNPFKVDVAQVPIREFLYHSLGLKRNDQSAIKSVQNGDALLIVTPDDNGSYVFWLMEIEEQDL